MAKIRIGLVGCGFVSELHMYAYRRVYGVDVEVKAVAARGDRVVGFAGRHQIPRVYRSFRDLMADSELDVVDICTPPNLHAAMIVDARAESTSFAKSRSRAISDEKTTRPRSASTSRKR
jgi:predicted dehydrogenase